MRSFTNMENNQDFTFCISASPNFAADGVIYTAKQSGLFRSSDGGLTWEDAYQSLNLETAIPTTFVTLVAPAEAQYVFAGVEGNVLRSMDAGQSWEVAELGTPAPVINALVPAPTFASDGLILAATMADGIARSTTRGASWSAWNFGLFDPNINALTFSPQYAADQTIYAATQSGIFRSTNGGRSWRDLDFPIEAAPVLALTSDSHGRIFAGSEQGLYTTSDGIIWDHVFSGSVDQICLDAEKILISADADLQFSPDSGKSWQSLPGFEGVAAPTCLAAPLGLNPGAPLFIGRSDGQVLSIPLNP
jgi:hypothetical protein